MTDQDWSWIRDRLPVYRVMLKYWIRISKSLGGDVVDFYKYDLTPDQIEEIDKELKETLGVEVDHEPFLSEQFRELLMETETQA